MNNLQRELKIVEYVQNHIGCKTKEACDGVETYMSRGTFFRLLDGLKEKNIIKSEQRNKREQSLFVVKNDPLVLISENLDKFEFYYFELFDRMIEVLKKPTKEIQRMREQENPRVVWIPSNQAHLFYSTMYIFQERVTNYLLKISVRYPTMISDKKYLEKLTSIVLIRISELYSKLFDRLKNIDEKYLDYLFDKRKFPSLADSVIHDFAQLTTDYDSILDMISTLEFFGLKNLYFKVPRFDV